MRGFGISFISFISDMNNGLMVIYLLLEVNLKIYFIGLKGNFRFLKLIVYFSKYYWIILDIIVWINFIVIYWNRFRNI